MSVISSAHRFGWQGPSIRLGQNWSSICLRADRKAIEHRRNNLGTSADITVVCKTRHPGCIRWYFSSIDRESACLSPLNQAFFIYDSLTSYTRSRHLSLSVSLDIPISHYQSIGLSLSLRAITVTVSCSCPTVESFVTSSRCFWPGLHFGDEQRTESVFPRHSETDVAESRVDAHAHA